MTYRELLSKLQQMDLNNDSRLDDTLTVFEPYTDEFSAIVSVEESIGDVLDEGHLYLVMKA